MILRSTLMAGAAFFAMTSVAQAAETLNIYAWADSIAPELIEKFEKQTGIKINVDSYTSNEDALTKLQAGASGYDIVEPSQHFVKIMIDEGLLEDIDAHDLEGFKNVDPKWTGKWWDENNDYSIPFAYGSTSFTVNRDVYDGPIDSWKVFFEPPEGLKGKIAASSSGDETISEAQLYLGVPFCTEDKAEMKKVRDLLLKQKPDVAVYSVDNIGNRIASGEVGAHSWWDGNSLKVRMNDGANIEYAFPKEGIVGWMDSLVVPKGAKNVENAKKFMNFMAEPENATIQYNFYAHSSPYKIIEEKAKYTKENAPELFPDVPVEFQRACSPEAQELVSKVWNEVQQ